MICPDSGKYPKCKTCCGDHNTPHGYKPDCLYRSDSCPACVPSVEPLADVEQADYPACSECGRSDRPVCCIPVEQLASEPSAMAREILNLRAERDVLKAELAALNSAGVAGWLAGIAAEVTK